MSRVDQPLLGSMLEQIRGTAGPGGRKMSRTDFGALLGITPTQVRNLEQGRALKSGEYEAIVARFPQIETGELLIQAVHVSQVTGQSTFNPAAQATRWTGMRCIQCHAAYRDDGSIQHKAGCPSSLARASADIAAALPATLTEAVGRVESAIEFAPPVAALPYCTCTERNAGWTNVDDQWVCGACGKLSKMVYDQKISAPQQVFGDLVALDEELEDPELQVAQQSRPDAAVRTELPVLYFSNSEVQCFKRCRRKWYLAWYRQLGLRVQSLTGALAIGNRVHRALQAWYVPESETPIDPRTALERAIQADWQAAVQAYGEIGLEPPAELVRDFSDSTSLERAMVEGYAHWLVETGVDSGLQVIASETYVEVPLEVPGSDVDVKLIGKMDVRVRREIDGARLFIDHKTVGSLTEPLKTIRLDPQMLHYHVLEWLSDVEEGRCDGALYNMLRKVKRTARATPPFYDRVEVRHNEHELQAFKRQLVGVIKSMLDTRARLDAGEDPAEIAYPTPTKNCSWDCDFLPVCPMHDDGSRVEAMLQQHYAIRDPYSYYREKEGA